MELRNGATKLYSRYWRKTIKKRNKNKTIHIFHSKIIEWKSLNQVHHIAFIIISGNYEIFLFDSYGVQINTKLKLTFLLKKHFEMFQFHFNTTHND